MEKFEKLVRRGDLYYLDFGITVGSEQNGVRPVIVVSNKMANRYSPTILVSPITSRFSKKELPTHVRLNYKECGLNRESQVLLEQIYTVDKIRLGTYIGSADEETMRKINLAAEISIQVGSAKDIYDREEIKNLKRKIKSIEELEMYVKMWCSFNKTKPIIEISERIKELEERKREMKLYSEEIRVDYREYYPENFNIYDCLDKMVG